MVAVYIASFAVIVLLVLLYLDGWGTVIAREPFGSAEDHPSEEESWDGKEDTPLGAITDKEGQGGLHAQLGGDVYEEESGVAEKEWTNGDTYDRAVVTASESSRWAAEASTSYQSAFLPPPIEGISNIHPFHSVSPDMCMDAGSGKCLF